MWANERPALDAAMAFRLHLGHQGRGASEAERWTPPLPSHA